MLFNLQMVKVPQRLRIMLIFGTPQILHLYLSLLQLEVILLQRKRVLFFKYLAIKNLEARSVRMQMHSLCEERVHGFTDKI